jgi:hypothetical protein
MEQTVDIHPHSSLRAPDITSYTADVFYLLTNPISFLHLHRNSKLPMLNSILSERGIEGFHFTDTIKK